MKIPLRNKHIILFRLFLDNNDDQNSEKVKDVSLEIMMDSEFPTNTNNISMIFYTNYFFEREKEMGETLLVNILNDMF